MDRIEGMYSIKELKNGEFFKLKEGSKRVYIKGEYDKSGKSTAVPPLTMYVWKECSEEQRRFLLDSHSSPPDDGKLVTFRNCPIGKSAVVGNHTKKSERED